MMRRDIDEALQGWPYDPEPGEVVAREIRAKDGRLLLQIRVELGMLQLEVEGRPDGVRPHNFLTYLDFLRHRATDRSGGPTSAWKMEPIHRAEADREFAQFSHRRVAWLSLHRYNQALRDADHTLALMDFVVEHSDDAEYVDSHEKFRSLVIFQRTQALVRLALERRKPEEAIDAVHSGGEMLLSHQNTWSHAHDGEDGLNEPFIEQLRSLESEIRKNFAIAKTLKEQLDEAVSQEDYERAARLRDLIRLRDKAKR